MGKLCGYLVPQQDLSSQLLQDTPCIKLRVSKNLQELYCILLGFQITLDCPHFIVSLPNSLSCRLQASAVPLRTTGSQRLLNHKGLSHLPVTKYYVLTPT